MDIIAGDLTITLRPDWQRVVLRSAVLGVIGDAETLFHAGKIPQALVVLRDVIRRDASLRTFEVRRNVFFGRR